MINDEELNLPRGPRRPTAAEVAAARGKTVPDLIAPSLKVLFCGINPSLYSAAVGHHFARPGNRFWPALHAGGFTSRILRPCEERELLTLGYGIVNIVDRATGAADELTAEELVVGGRRLEAKVRRHRPGVVAFLGITAYRMAFGRKRARLGRQAEAIAGARVWVLTNPSGRCVSFSDTWFRELCQETARMPQSREGHDRTPPAPVRPGWGRPTNDRNRTHRFRRHRNGLSSPLHLPIFSNIGSTFRVPMERSRRRPRFDRHERNRQESSSCVGRRW